MANPIDATQKASQEIQAMILKATRKAYFAGLRIGVSRFAWQKDGVLYVGPRTYHTGRRMLSDALVVIDEEEKR